MKRQFLQFPIVNSTLELFFSPLEAIVLVEGKIPERVNFVGGEILELCNGIYTEKDIIRIMSKRYKDNEDDVGRVIHNFLEESVQRGFITFSSISSSISNPREGFVIGAKDRYIPYTIVIEITRKCNLRCKHCYDNAGKARENELSFDEWNRVIDDFVSEGTENIFITGGEPFVYPDIMSNTLIQWSKKFVSIVVATNGYEISQRIVDLIGGIPNISFQISLDGDEEIHDYIRGQKGTFKKAISSVLLLSQKGFPVTVAMTLNPLNKDKIEEVIKISKTYMAKEFRVGWTFSHGRAKDKKWDFDENTFTRLSDLIIKLVNKYEDEHFTILRGVGKGVENEPFIQGEEDKNCGAGSLVWSILSDGKVVPCLPLPVLLGDIRNNSVGQIGASEVVKTFANTYTPNKKICSQCSQFYICEGCFVEGFINSQIISQCFWSKSIKNLIK